MTLLIIACFWSLIANVIASSIDVYVKDDTCATYDSCSVADFFRTCSCHEDCPLYGTCCLDAPTFNSMSPENTQFHCKTHMTITPVFSRNNCAPDFKGTDEVVKKCQRDTFDAVDIENHIPVSSNFTFNTYQNWYCALCNNEEEANVMKWNTQVTCDTRGNKNVDQKYIRKNLIFDGMENSWGLNIDGVFTACTLNFMQPVLLTNRLKYCAPNMISDCPHGFKDMQTIKKCRYYHGERKQRGKNMYFKNVHCAACNWLQPKGLECFGRNYRPFILNSSNSAVRVIFESGSWVDRTSGSAYNCTNGLAYNPFQSKCMSFQRMVYDRPQANNDGASLYFGLSALVFALIFLFVNKVIHCRS